MNLIFSMDTDTNLYNWYGRLLAANKVGYFLFFIINFSWCNLLIHVASVIIVRSV